MIRPFTLAIVAVFLTTSPASACYSWKCEEAATNAPSRSYITNTHRQKIGDLYKPSPDRRVQIRDKHRRILGYIEKDGTITNTHRQKVLGIEALRE